MIRLTLKNNNEVVEFVDEELVKISKFKLKSKYYKRGLGEWKILIKSSGSYEIIGTTEEYDSLVKILIKRRSVQDDLYYDEFKSNNNL